jgi:hypothetical protein
MKCQVKIGIFSLRECGNTPQESCANCNIFICPSHIRITESNVLCPECEIKLYPNSKNIQNYNNFNNGQEVEYDNRWYFYNRSSFYNTSDYVPFDDNDYGSFAYDETITNDLDDKEIKGSISDS